MNVKTSDGRHEHVGVFIPEKEAPNILRVIRDAAPELCRITAPGAPFLAPLRVSYPVQAVLLRIGGGYVLKVIPSIPLAMQAKGSMPLHLFFFWEPATGIIISRVPTTPPARTFRIWNGAFQH